MVWSPEFLTPKVLEFIVDCQMRPKRSYYDTYLKDFALLFGSFFLAFPPGPTKKKEVGPNQLN